MLLKKTLLITTVAATAATAAVVTAGAASASPSIAGTYNPVAPKRVLDTRSGIGATKTAVGAGKTVTFSVAKALGTTLVSAEALTVTAINPAASGYLLVYPGGTTRPNTSTVNYQPGSTTSNAAVVPYGTTGSVSIYNSSTAAVNVTADLSGYWTGGSVASTTSGAYTPVANTRIFQTKSSGQRLAGGADLTVPVVGKAAIPAGVSAVAVNVTAALPAGSGYLATTANATDQQGTVRTSDVAFQVNQSRAALVIVPVDPATGDISIYNGSIGSVDVIVDTVGYFTGGSPYLDGSFVSSTPYRNSDTRSTAAVGPGKSVKVDLGVGSADGPSLFKAVVAGVTETDATKPGYLTAYSGTGTRPGVASLTFSARTASSEAIVPINADGSITIYNGSTSSVQVIVDVHGFVLNDLSAQTPAAARAQVHSAVTHARKAAVARTSR